MFPILFVLWSLSIIVKLIKYGFLSSLLYTKAKNEKKKKETNDSQPSLI